LRWRDLGKGDESRAEEEAKEAERVVSSGCHITGNLSLMPLNSV
jgi:hypothetical protein